MHVKAEGKGFEPSTHCWASDFESDRWPIRIPSDVGFKFNKLKNSRYSHVLAARTRGDYSLGGS